MQRLHEKNELSEMFGTEQVVYHRAGTSKYQTTRITFGSIW